MFKLTQLTAVPVSTVYDSDDNTINLFSEPERFVKFDTDPLLLSCTLYRMIKEQPNSAVRCYSLDNHGKEIAKQITSEDRELSTLVGKYYKDKVLVQKLKGEELTKFRTDLYTYLSERPYNVSAKFIGMIYKLPYFYEYDKGLSEIFGIDQEVQLVHYFIDTKHMNFISKLNAHKKRTPEYEYWFSDEQGIKYMVPVAKSNPLVKLWESTVSKEPVNINAKFERKYRDGRGYFVATGWKFDETQS